MTSSSIITAAVIAIVFGAMLLMERVRPLRATVESKPRRIARNLTTGAIAYATVTLLGAPLLVPFATWITDSRIGLLGLTDLPRVANIVIAIVLLDYTLWIWHFANHRIAFLWRFHLVHHVDRDMDSSTALRFHFGEHALSMVYRVAQIVVIGAPAEAVWIWQTILFASILFHHANINLPVAWERHLVRLIVTPRMHGIHHSTYLSETDSNWSSLLSVWDYLHRTIVLNVPHSEITIGVPAYAEASDVTVGRILAMPFRRQRNDWHRSDGALQTRPHPEPVAQLAG